MNGIKCKYCGKIYESPRIMRTKKCHCHPKGAWGGYCTPDSVKEFLWEQEKNAEISRKATEKIEEERADAATARCEYKNHTPLLDCILGDYFDGEISDSALKMQNSNLNEFALGLASGLKNESREAINTIYALLAGCDYVLNNPNAQEEGSLKVWLEEIKQLKMMAADRNFWCSVYWFTKPLEDAKSGADEKYKQSIIDDDYDAKMRYGKEVSYWISNPLAKVFHVKQTMPMLRILRILKKEADESDQQAMRAIKDHVSHIIALKSENKGFEKLNQTVIDPAFWSALYCLYWIKLRPTPWNDQKVWPIR